MLHVLPHVAEVECFALKGGTAINLFHYEMPRLSVDIDLTYVPVEDRATAMAGITAGLEAVRKRLVGSGLPIQASLMPQTDGQETKLLCRNEHAQIKVEVNTTIRGCLQPPENMAVVQAVQDEFGLFAAINVVSKGELYGGKICAALDRQHPRDLFDIHQLFQHGGITDEIRLGFVAMLAGHNRPAQEMLNPNYQDQHQLFEEQFQGMTLAPFTYADFEVTREQLVTVVNKCLTAEDRAFLLSLTAGEPDWSLYPIAELEDMSAIKWKLLNIQKLKGNNPEKHDDMLRALQAQLDAD
nr:nucleotidyl transferase AbiEii/AbiGii toxin family protein [Parahaliea mediterranea]